MAYRPSLIRVTLRTARPRRLEAAGWRSAITSSQPDTSKARISDSRPDVTSWPPTTMATRLQSASASDRMWELKNTVQPRSRSSQDERPDVAPAERIEARHRLVEEDQFGLVDEGLREADALQHAFRELAQREASFAGDAHPVEQAGHALAPLLAAQAEEAGEVGQQLLGGEVVVEVRRFRQDIRCAGERQDGRAASRAPKSGRTSGKSAPSAA